MRRLASILAVLLAGWTVLVTASAATRLGPTLALVSRAPVVVSGKHFGSRERVQLLPANAPAISTQANRAGSFTATLSGTFVSRCSGFSLTARGSRGSVAYLKLPRPACMPVRAY